MEFQEFETHFPEKISKSLVNYVTNTVLKSSRYLFYKTVLGAQFAYCTHCQKRHHSKEKLKHKQKERVTCPHCKSSCEVRSMGMSRKYMKDRAVFVWYEKSKKHSATITARIISVIRDYSQDYKDVQTGYNCGDMYLFSQGESHYYHLGYCGWEKRKTVFSGFDNILHGSKHGSFSNIRRAVKGTPFQYSTWEEYTKYRNHMYVSDMVEFFDLAARYPCVEYLTKLGFEKLIWAKLYKNRMYSAVNWRGKTPEKILRLDRHDILQIRNSGLTWGPEELAFLQKMRRNGHNYSIQDAHILSHVDDGIFRQIKDEIGDLATKKEMRDYLLRQHHRPESRYINSLAYDWRDYLRQCKELGIDIRERRYLYPNDLHRAHQKLTNRIKLKRDERLDNLIVDRQENLQKYIFEWNGLIARPVESLQELFDEGKALNHCVGSYADTYAEGRTNIFVVRKQNDPETPYYTMEFSAHGVHQCQGKNHRVKTEEIQGFLDQFISKKLLNKKRTRIDITGIRQQEAVI